MNESLSLYMPLAFPLRMCQISSSFLRLASEMTPSSAVCDHARGRREPNPAPLLPIYIQESSPPSHHALSIPTLLTPQTHPLVLPTPPPIYFPSSSRESKARTRDPPAPFPTVQWKTADEFTWLTRHLGHSPRPGRVDR